MIVWKRVLKRTGKILLITFLSFFLLLIALVVVVLNSESFITRQVLKEVSSTIKAPVTVENITIRYFRNFPNLTVELSQLTLGGYTNDSVLYCFPEQPDGLLKLNKFYLAVKVKPLLDNRVEVDKIEIDGFTLNYCVDSAGKTNFDFLTAEEPAADSVATDTAPSSDLFVLLSDLTLRNIQVNYSDQSAKIRASVLIPKMNIKAKVHNDSIESSLNGQFALSNLFMEGFNLHEIKQFEGSLNVDYDTDRVTVENLQLNIDNMRFTTSGSVLLRDSMELNLQVGLMNANVSNLVRYLPETILAENGVKSIAGTIGLQAQIEGILYDTLLLPGIKGSYTFEKFAVLTSEYPEIKNLYLAGDFSLLNPNDLSTFFTEIRKCRIEFPQSSIAFSGKVSNLDKINYSINTSGAIDLRDFIAFVPADMAESLQGKVSFRLSTWGILPDKPEDNPDYFLERTNVWLKVDNVCAKIDSVNEVNNLSLALNYSPNKHISLHDLSLQAPGYQIELLPSSLDVKLEGKTLDFDHLAVIINNFSFNLPGLTLNGNASIRGLTVSQIAMQTNLWVDIEQIKHLIPDSLFDTISGKVTLEMKSFGSLNLDSIDSQIEKFLFEQSTITLEANDFKVQLFGDPLVQLNNLTLAMSLANDTLKVDRFVATFHGIDIQAYSTQVWNIYRAFLKQERNIPLIVKTDLKISEFDYDKYMPLFFPEEASASTQADSVTNSNENTSTVADEVAGSDSAPETKSDTVTSDYMPPMILHGKFSIKKLRYGNMILKDISTLFRVDDSLYVVDNFRFNAWGGTMVTSAVYDTRKYPEVTVMFRNQIDRMNIHTLLVEANDFDQTDFTHKNISGIITSSFDGRIVMVGDSVIYDKIMIKGRFKLENGGIYNYEPIKELGKFTNLRELENIVFQTLESGVFIYNNKIFFPKTDIVSTAADISAFGMVSFGDEYQLHLKLHLSDALVGKSEKLLKAQGKQSDLFDSEGDKNRKGLYLLALNRNGETKYGFDNKRTQRMMNAEIRVQEQGLGLIFNPLLTNYSTELDRKEVKKKN